LQIIEEENLRAHAEAMGNVICDGLRAALKDVAGVVVIRNAGLMIGVELDRPCGDLVKRALAERLLINVTADKVVRLLPPLVINQSEAEQLVAILAKLVKQFLSE
jgi:acetylornithine aminotransferase